MPTDPAPPSEGESSPSLQQTVASEGATSLVAESEQTWHRHAGDHLRMPRAAPRIAWRLVEEITLLDEPGLAIAELWRRLCVRAAELGLPSPSYQQTRLLVHRSRQIRAMPGVTDLAVDVLFKTRSPGEAGTVAERRLQERRAARAAVDAERAWRSLEPPG